MKLKMKLKILFKQLLIKEFFKDCLQGFKKTVRHPDWKSILLKIVFISILTLAIDYLYPGQRGRDLWTYPEWLSTTAILIFLSEIADNILENSPQRNDA
jgi:hypothetical protein